MYLILVLYSLLICDKSQTPWSLYALLLATLSHSLITDPLLGFLLHRSTIMLDPLHRTLSFCIFALWLLFTKIIKLLPHFVLYPADICFIPATILFGYCHGPIKFYAFLTLHVVSPRNAVLFDIILNRTSSYKLKSADWEFMSAALSRNRNGAGRRFSCPSLKLLI